MFSPNLIRHCASCYRGISVSGSISLGPSTWILDIPSNGWRWSLYPALPARERATHTHTDRQREKEKRRGRAKEAEGTLLASGFRKWLAEIFWHHLILSPHLQHSLIYIYFLLWHWKFSAFLSFSRGIFFNIFFLNTFPDNPLGFGLFSVSSQQQLVFWGCFGQKWSAVAAV